MSSTEKSEWVRAAATEIYEKFIEWKAFDPAKDDRIAAIIAEHAEGHAQAPAQPQLAAAISMIGRLRSYVLCGESLNPQDEADIVALLKQLRSVPQAAPAQPSDELIALRRTMAVVVSTLKRVKASGVEHPSIDAIIISCDRPDSLLGISVPEAAPAQPEEQYKVPDTPETLARWVWFHYVGIPLTEPYDKEYTRLFDRIEALNRKSFVAGLNECRRQISVPQAAPTQPWISVEEVASAGTEQESEKKENLNA